MNNYQHILYKGIDHWNNWRKENPMVIPDLSNQKFDGINLCEGDFYKVNFTNSSLVGCDLSKADFTKANFTNAKLDGAFLVKSYLLETIFVNTSFLNCTFRETIFANAVIKKAQNLEQGVYLGYSYIDFKTINNSRGLPKSFLLGIGLKEWEVNFLLSEDKNILKLTELSLQIEQDRNEIENTYHSVFLSYSEKDINFASRFYADLIRSEIKCWFAPENIYYGSDIFDSIDQAIENFDKMIVILSKNSVESIWVEDEVKKMFSIEREKKEKLILPILIENIDNTNFKPWVKKLLENRHYAKIFDWNTNDAHYEYTLSKILRKSIIKKSAE